MAWLCFCQQYTSLRTSSAPHKDSIRGKYVPEALTCQTVNLEPVAGMKPRVGFAGSADGGAERSREHRKCHPVVSLGLPVSSGKCSVLLWREVRWLVYEVSLKRFITFLFRA